MISRVWLRPRQELRWDPGAVRLFSILADARTLLTQTCREVKSEMNSATLMGAMLIEDRARREGEQCNPIDVLQVFRWSGARSWLGRIRLRSGSCHSHGPPTRPSVDIQPESQTRLEGPGFSIHLTCATRLRCHTRQTIARHHERRPQVRRCKGSAQHQIPHSIQPES